jgi:hypothetical protein
MAQAKTDAIGYNDSIPVERQRHNWIRSGDQFVDLFGKIRNAMQIIICSIPANLFKSNQILKVKQHQRVNIILSEGKRDTPTFTWDLHTRPPKTNRKHHRTMGTEGDRPHFRIIAPANVV